MWGLSSQTRGLTHVPCIARQILNRWITREVPCSYYTLSGKGRLHLRSWPMRWLNAGSWYVWASPKAQWVKNLPAMQETQEMRVWSLGWEDPLEKEMAIHSTILTWKTPWAEEPGRLESKVSQESDMTKHAGTIDRCILLMAVFPDYCLLTLPFHFLFINIITEI